jgi:hypothetical protein
MRMKTCLLLGPVMRFYKSKTGNMPSRQETDEFSYFAMSFLCIVLYFW